MRKKLTKLTLEQKPPQKGRIDIRDTDSPLVFRLTDGGSRSFTVRTRLRGAQVRFTYPRTASLNTLEEARRWAHNIVAQCKDGIDPREVARQEQLQAERDATLQFRAMVELFMERHASKNKTWRDTQSIFDVHVLPRWGDRLITEITRSDVAALLDAVEDRASIFRANRVLAAIRKLFNWALARGLIDQSPVGLGMMRPANEW